jgi:hypothetical protein
MADDSKSNGNGNGNGIGRSWTGSRSENNTLEKTDTILTIGRLKFRGKTDDLPQ